jgi:ribosome recycling factor
MKGGTVVLKDVINGTEEKMKAVVANTKREFSTVRTGRANPAILDRVTVNYYNTPTPLNQLANIAVPEPRLITIQPWDKSSIKDVEKAILQSDLGLTPNNDGQIIRLVIPPLTGERRKELVRLVRKVAEEMRVAIRNIRRDINDTIKAEEKQSSLPEDDARRYEKQVQDLTDRYIKEIDQVLLVKEQEIMEV